MRPPARPSRPPARGYCARHARRAADACDARPLSARARRAQGIAWCASGVGYTCSVGAPPSLSAVLCGFVICFSTGFLAGNAPTLAEARSSWPLRAALALSFGRWSSECLCVAALGREPSAYQAQLGALYLDTMGIKVECAADAARGARGAAEPAPSDYSLEALLQWSRERGGGVTGGPAACARTAPLGATCGPHLLALFAIGLVLRLLAYAMLVRAKREREGQPPPLCWHAALGALRRATLSAVRPWSARAAGAPAARDGARTPSDRGPAWQRGSMV